MKILIKDISEKSTRKELTAYVYGGLRGPWYKMFKVQGEVMDVDILRMTDVDSGDVEYHGLVEVEPTLMAWEVIRKLNGSRFNGRVVVVRKWFDRTGAADRRLYYERNEEGKLMERRSGDDRRRNLRIESSKSIRIKGVDGFQREHHD